MKNAITCRDRIDAAGEREAAAIEALEENAGAVQPPTRLALAREVEYCARARSLPAVRHQRYPKMKSIRAWCRIVDSMRQGRRVQNKPFVVTTAADRARYVARRLERQRLLAELNQMPDARLPWREAASLVSLRPLGMYKALRENRIPRIRDGHRLMVAVSDLRTYLSTKS